MTFATYLTHFLESSGVHSLFALSGANIEEFIYEVWENSSIEGTLVKHEAMAVAMALGSVKAGAPFGAVAVTSGAASFNTIPMLAEAYSSDLPLLLIAGGLSYDKRGIGAFQESDGSFGTPHLLSAFSAVSRYTCEVDAQTDLDHLCQHILATFQQTPGPVVLMVPQNLWSTPTSSVFLEPPIASIASTPHALPTLPLLSSRSCIYLGPETTGWDNKQLVQFCEYLGVAVVCAPQAKGVIDNYHPQFAGVAGIMGNPSAQDVLLACDTLIALGTSLPSMERYGWEEGLENKNVILIGRKNYHFPSALFLEGTLNDYYKQLCSYYSPGMQQKQHLTYLYDERKDVVYREYAQVLSTALSGGDTITVDAGNSGAAMVHYLRLIEGVSFDIALGMGGMAYGFGAALGASIEKGSRSWLCSGDGSFFMHGLELHTALEKQLDLRVIIFDNSAHEMCHTREESLYNHSTTINTFTTQLSGEGLGSLFSYEYAFDCSSPQEVKLLLEKYHTYKGLLCIVIHLPAHLPIPFDPFLPTEELS